MPSTDDVSQTPIKTTLSGARSILVTVIILTFIYTAILINDRRDHVDFRDDLIDISKNQSTNTASIGANTLALGISMAESKNNEENAQRERDRSEQQYAQLMQMMNTLIDGLQ